MNMFNLGVAMRRSVVLCFLMLLLSLALPLSAAASTLLVDPGGENSCPADRTFKSIQAALKMFRPGDTLLIVPGEYRETIRLPKLKSGSRLTTIGVAGEGDVVIKGSDVVDSWFPVKDDIWVRENWETNSQQVFVDGELLTQIGGVVFGGYPAKPDHPLMKFRHSVGDVWKGRIEGDEKALPEMAFYCDMENDKLYIRLKPGMNPNLSKVEASVRRYLLFAVGWDRLAVSGLMFQHSNTTDRWRHGAVSLWGDGMTLERVTVEYADGGGIHVVGDDNVIINSRADHCGRVGLVAKGNGCRIEDCVTNFNNYRGFNQFWEAGGTKFVGGGGLNKSSLINHTAMYNDGSGIWFDWGNRDNLISGCLSAFNAVHGLHYEASFGGIVVNNILYGNGRRGIYLVHSSDSYVAHNLVAFNKLSGIVVIDEGVKDPKGVLDLRPNNNRIYGNIIAWNKAIQGDLLLPRERKNNTSDFNLMVTEKSPPLFSLGWLRGRPWVKGLYEWQMNSGQDMHSAHVQVKPDHELIVQIAARETVHDWSQLFKMAHSISVPVESKLKTYLEVNEDTLYVGPNHTF